ncbi:ABC transporter permease subunit [Synechococcus sp. CS-602]|uniref:glycine betaine ABC transporter substrate-binding protein n=1 Tax=Synechococcaceae TaxID=1890426 RepID=UPI0008FF3D29|nr:MULTISPECIES: glycine betaine ABC transporter substrate-binding protein [Synechococcaceae]MCT4365229.1 ABC transporter permease subunit [Candidatus Regnicoccus frigidus MAG-AL1]APD48590.1 glycine/betaine ABC transporter substrate-binding protein [Synechococcus sp. SynAce01]MCT0205083.1 ABC transporter permease subunit [Synechococcus sp. CS-602]MCT0245814.1 ABC transporter permease subunit [Synechococcus sp. CS-601]MCT4367338.1 ABC transporter permease subunit [Candidatus Regnicoccus frigidu
MPSGATLTDELLSRCLEHAALVAVAMALALAISLPLGLWISRRPRWAGPVLAVVSAIQTIPSLAIFGVLITVPLVGGLGARPAIVALTLYALLPLVRGVVTGLTLVPQGLKEAAMALGLNRRQRLWRVEVPLALPVLMAGVRVAMVLTIAVATIAAAIGAGGLGVFLFRGIATVNNGLILQGAVPAALMALLADWALSSRRRLLAGLGLAVALALAAGLWLARPAAAPSLAIGSKAFTEQLLLGELLAQQIEAQTNLRVRRDFALGGTQICHEAVRSGQIAGYVEYTGTAWASVLNQAPLPAQPGLDRAEAVYERARTLYRQRFDLEMFPSLGFENSFAILIRDDQAKALGLTKLSQLAPHTPQWRAGFGFEFLSRPDGYPGLARLYGLRFKEAPLEMDLGLTYRALAEGRVDLIAGDSTNGLIETLALRSLIDDRQYFPPYQATPVFNAAALRRWPQLLPALNGLAGQISEAEMRRMNAAVDGEGEEVAAVVRRFRQGKGWTTAAHKKTPPGRG